MVAHASNISTRQADLEFKDSLIYPRDPVYKPTLNILDDSLCETWIGKSRDSRFKGKRKQGKNHFWFYLVEKTPSLYTSVCWVLPWYAYFSISSSLWTFPLWTILILPSDTWCFHSTYKYFNTFVWISISFRRPLDWKMKKFFLTQCQSLLVSFKEFSHDKW